MLFPETACANGFYSTGGAVACTECPTGSRCPDKTLAPSQCTLGNYAGPGSMTCTSCEVGNYCANAGMSAPVACPAGSYQTGTGQSSCITCLAGETIVSLLFAFPHTLYRRYAAQVMIVQSQPSSRTSCIHFLPASHSSLS